MDVKWLKDENNNDFYPVAHEEAVIDANGKILKDKLNETVKKTDVVDNLTTESTDAPLSAKQGKELSGKIDELNQSLSIIKENLNESPNEESECGFYNNKKLYCRSIQYDMDNRKEVSLSNIVPDCRNIIRTIGMTLQPNANLVPCPYYLNDGDYAAYYISTTQSILTYRCGANYGKGTFYLKIYYTK